MNRLHWRRHLPALCAGVIVLVYSLLSFCRIGYSYAPESGWESEEKNAEILLDLGEEKEIGSLTWYLGKYENRSLQFLIGAGDPVVWEEQPAFEPERVYQWGTIPVRGKGRFLKLVTKNQFTDIKELILADAGGARIEPVNAAEYPALFDEAWMYPGRSSFLAGTVFDESVFARTAYEYLHGIRSYEDTHPPLGKLLISVGIALFGMNPFGWRVMGAVAGILLLLVLWKFAGRLFENPWTSVGVLALMALDFLHFTESRLGQVDSFLVLFMTGMYYFMYRYYECMERDGGGNGWGFLAGSGLCMGLAVACKWSGLYGAVGLALIWAIVVVRAIRRKRLTWRDAWRTCGLCCLFFVLIPAAIYVTSYIPYVVFDRDMGFWERLLRNQVNMFRYHSHVGGYHGSGSRWYEWSLIIRPIVLYASWFSDRTEMVVLMGNPAFWWAGMAAVFASLVQALEQREHRVCFLLTAYLAPILPWIVISRYSFLYHYYPSLPFLALMIGLIADRGGRRGQCGLAACVLIAGLLFVLFYPIISGQMVAAEYVARWLEWLPTWEFTA